MKAGEKRLGELKKDIKQSEELIDQNQELVIKILKNYDIKDIDGFKKLEKEAKEKLREIKGKLDNEQSVQSELKVKFSAENTALQYLKKELIELKKTIELKASLNQKIEIFASLRDWVKNEFPVLIRDIEREILLSSASQFNEYFKEWFHLLVEEQNIEVEIRPDDFEPIIMVNGYESPFNDMSGGEKSAISLAYRLALNKIINERYQDVKTKDLLILDEPTDGFSQEQIKKMQDLFDSLNTEQLIIISHDSALYSCVTDIYNFKKENHITKVKKE
jgi:exonuclease SbcC